MHPGCEIEIGRVALWQVGCLLPGRGRSNNSEKEDLRRTILAVTETDPGGGLSAPQISYVYDRGSEGVQWEGHR